MRVPLFALALTLAPLAACTTTGPAWTTDVQLTSAKGLFAAEAAFEASTISAEAGVKSGQLHGRNAKTVLDALDSAHSAILVGRAAYLVGNMAAVATQTALATTSLQAASAALPPK